MVQLFKVDQHTLTKLECLKQLEKATKIKKFQVGHSTWLLVCRRSVGRRKSGRLLIAVPTKHRRDFFE